MTYRDDRKRLELRVKELEGELARAHDKIARLEGQVGAAAPPPQETNWLLRAPTTLHLERDLGFEVDDDAYEAINEMVPARVGHARAEQVGRTLTVTAGHSVLRVTRPEKGRSKVTLTASHQIYVLLAWLFNGMAIFFSLPAIIAPLEEGYLPPLSFAVMLPMVIVLTTLIARELATRVTKKASIQAQGVFETAVGLAEQHHQRKRIAVDEAAGGEAEVPAEAEAEAEAAAADVANLRA